MPDVAGQRVATKLSYAAGVPEWEWYVGTGVYIDELEREIAALELRQTKRIRADIAGILSILLILLLVSLVAALLTSRTVKKGVVAITDFFEQASRSSASLIVPPLAIPEFIQLADAANRILIDRLRAEEEKRRLEEKVQHTQRLESLGVLAGGIAHDFNNLLQAILGNAELARPELPVGSKVNENFAAIETASHRAAELCQQLLSYSGQGSFKTERIDLKFLVREMSQIISVSVPKGIEMTYAFSEEPAFVEADAAQLRQVVLNIITNAAEAIGKAQGSIRLRIKNLDVQASEEPRVAYLPDPLSPGLYVELLVIDDGEGMDEDTLTHIFDPFYTTKFTGRGLGLAAVLGIARSHAGAIQVESEPGVGTRFFLLLPASDGSEAHAVGQPTVGLRKDNNGIVLVVDDEQAIQLVARQMLERVGYEVLSAFDGQQALDLFHDHQEDIGCVLMDLMMPKMDGIEAFAAIHKIAPELPIILTSGYDEKNFLERLPSQHLAGFIQKPFKMRELINAIERAFSA